jgi:Fe-S-cluster-containing hydrogenase component 2
MDVAHLTTMCNQCDNAPCIAAAGNRAVYKRADGIVMIDPELAKGRRELVEACPYGHIWWNEELSVPQKWFFDAHLLDAGWKEPRCTQSCATGCLTSVCCEDGAMQARIAKEQLAVLKPELGTRPRIYYRNLHRFVKEFIAGSICYQAGDTEETAAGATVELLKEGTALQSATTDFFGDFKFDGLEPDSGTYTLRISFPGCREKILPVELSQSVNLGAIKLDGTQDFAKTAFE